MVFEIHLASDDDARDVLFGMHQIVERYGVVTVHDVYSLIGMNAKARHSDMHSGWKGDGLDVDIISTSIRGDYCIMRLPDPVAIISIDA